MNRTSQVKGTTTKKPGRLVLCSRCSTPTALGTTQVFRKIVFHFCLDCWHGFKLECSAWMQRVCRADANQNAAA